MAYPKSQDPVKTRGISVPESLWQGLKLYAKAESRSASSLVSILVFEAVNARRIKYGEAPFADLEEMRVYTAGVVAAGKPEYGRNSEAVIQEAKKKPSKAA